MFYQSQHTSFSFFEPFSDVKFVMTIFPCLSRFIFLFSSCLLCRSSLTIVIACLFQHQTKAVHTVYVYSYVPLEFRVTLDAILKVARFLLQSQDVFAP